MIARQRTSLCAIVLTLVFGIASGVKASSPTLTQTRPLRVLLPVHDDHFQFSKEFERIVADFNHLHPKARVEISQRSGRFTVLKELVVAQMADQLPDIAFIETGELEAFEKADLAKELPRSKIGAIIKGMSPIVVRQSKTAIGKLISLPFQRTAPLIVVDQEKMFRHYLNPNQLPATWIELVNLAIKLQSFQSGEKAPVISAPLVGERGLWIFEAIHGTRIWETPLSKKNKKTQSLTASTFKELRELSLDRKLLEPRLDWEDSIEAFVERKIPILLISSDALPLISQKAEFRWNAVPLPRFSKSKNRRGKKSFLSNGSQIVVLKHHPSAWAFLNHLYEPSNGSRWAVSGGFLPLKKNWTRAKVWKRATQSKGKYVDILKKLRPGKSRTSHPEIIRVRSEWSKALPELLGVKGSPPRPLATLLKEIAKTH